MSFLIALSKQLYGFLRDLGRCIKLFALMPLLIMLNLSACKEPVSPYVLNCLYDHKSRPRQHIIITDDTLMQLASRAIYEDLKAKNKLDFLPEGAGPHTLHHMYLSPRVTVLLVVMPARGFMSDPTRTKIRVRFDIEPDENFDSIRYRTGRIYYDVDYQDCGQVSVRSALDRDL